MQKLRQLVQGSRAQEPPEPRQTLGVRAFAAAHCPELEHGEDAAAFPRALLAKQDWTPVNGQYRERDKRGERNPQRGRQDDCHRFEHSFHGTIIANYGIIYPHV